MGSKKKSLNEEIQMRKKKVEERKKQMQQYLGKKEKNYSTKQLFETKYIKK